MINKTRFRLPTLTAARAAIRPGWSRLLPWLGVGLVLLVVACLSYFTFTQASLAPVAVGKLPITSTAAQPALERQIALSAINYRLVLYYPDKSRHSFNLNDVGIKVDSAVTATNIKQNLRRNVWQRLTWWRPIRLSIVTHVDITKLHQFISSKASLVTTSAVNATLSAANGKAVITPEIQGTSQTVSEAEHTILEKVATLDEGPLRLVPHQLTPEISTTDLKPAQTKLTAILNQRINLSVGDKAVTVSPPDIAAWVEITPVVKDKTVDITVNSGKVAGYIERFTSSYVQSARNRVVMDTPAGEMVLDPGTDGVDVAKKAETATAVAEHAQSGIGFTADLPITSVSAKTVHVPLADKILVVDTSTKRMYAYEKTDLVRTVLVSAGAPKTPTVLGQFAIYAKLPTQDMRGANADGSRYFQPAVPYVNYFYKDYAVHGNYWRDSSYFGNINSSHGCVGIAAPDDEWIYNWAPIGTPVVVHD